MDQHELISILKDLALELGRTPSRAQFEVHVKGGRYRCIQLFGTYSALLTAAGLAPNVERRITNQVFEQPIEKVLEKYEPHHSTIPEIYPKAEIISDIHFPFPNVALIEKFYKRVELKQPDHVILNGDAWDMFSHSKFPRSHNIFTPREEQNLSRKMEEEFWKEIQKRAPKAKCHRLPGNHDLRPLKRILESYPAAEDWIEKMLHELWTYDGVKTIFDHREELILGNVMFHHGYRSKLGDHRDYVLYNIVVGHTHLAGIVYRHLIDRTIWEMNCGFAGDPQAKGLTYTPQRLTNWTPSFSEIDEAGPRVIM